MEFAVIVRSDLKGEGIGRALLQKLIGYCRSRGEGSLVGQVLNENRSMLSLPRHLGGSERFDSESGLIEIRLPLNER